MIRTLLLIYALAALTFAVPASAYDASLYPEAAPEDAAFVRFFDAGDARQVEFAGVTFTLHPDEDGAYIPVSAARLNGVAAGSFVSVVAGHPIYEGSRSNRAKVHLFMVNATDAPLDLRVVQDAIPVLERVAPMTAGVRAVNPLRITLGIFDADGTVRSTFDVTMQRGQNLSFVATRHGVQLVTHRFAAVAK
ncbi:MAG: hypothetical protein AAF218_04790 [Pseudomonadota bacterium]